MVHQGLSGCPVSADDPRVAGGTLALVTDVTDTKRMVTTAGGWGMMWNIFSPGPVCGHCDQNSLAKLTVSRIRPLDAGHQNTTLTATADRDQILTNNEYLATLYHQHDINLALSPIFSHRCPTSDHRSGQ